MFYFVEKKVSKPMFDFSLLKINLFTSSNIAIFLNALARGAFTLVMVFSSSGAINETRSLDAGVFLMPVSLALAVFAPISGWLYDKYNFSLIAPGGCLSAAGFFILSSVGATMSFYDSVLPLVLVGAGMGIFASPNRTIIMNSVPSFRRGVAAGTTLVMTGSAFSIGLVFLVFTQIMPLHETQNIFSGSFDALNIDTMKVDAFVTSLQAIFLISAILMVVSTIPFILKLCCERYQKINE